MQIAGVPWSEPRGACTHACGVCVSSFVYVVKCAWPHCARALVNNITYNQPAGALHTAARDYRNEEASNNYQKPRNRSGLNNCIDFLASNFDLCILH